MFTKNLAKVCAILMTVLTFAACEGSKQEPTDPRNAFVGNYSFVTTGNIDLYAGSKKIVTVPLDKKGDMSITLGEVSNTVWIISSGDSALAYVSDNQLFMDPSVDEMTFGELVMHLSFTYGKATLNNETLTWNSEVEITASYKDLTLTGSGQVEIVATKK